MKDRVLEEAWAKRKEMLMESDNFKNKIEELRNEMEEKGLSEKHFKAYQEYETLLRIANDVRKNQNKLMDNDEKMSVETFKLLAENDYIEAEAHKYWAEMSKINCEKQTYNYQIHVLETALYKLKAEADILWGKSIFEVKGNIKIGWFNGKCTLENGEIYWP